MVGQLSKVGLLLAPMVFLMVGPAWAKDGGPPGSEGARERVLSAVGPPRLVVHMSVARSGDTATYSITLRNPGEGEVQDVFIAGGVASGTTFVEAGANPARGGFRAVEAGAAVFLSEGVPSNGRQGPFSYRVKLSGDAAGPVRAWVHWRSPTDSTTISAPISVLPAVTVAPLASGPAGKLPQEPLIWRVIEAPFAAQSQQASSIQSIGRVFYQFEGTSVLVKEGVMNSYGPGSAGFIGAGGTPPVNANRGDATSRRWVFFPLPARERDDPVAGLVLFNSDVLTGLKDAPYTLLLAQAELQPGGSATPHHHPGPVVVYVQEGTLTHTEKGATRTYGPGSFWVEETAEPNTTRNIGNTVARVLAAFLVPEGEDAATFLEPPPPGTFR